MFDEENKLSVCFRIAEYLVKRDQVGIEIIVTMPSVKLASKPCLNLCPVMGPAVVPAVFSMFACEIAL